MDENANRLRWFIIGNITMYALIKWTRGVAARAGVRKEFTEEDKEKIKEQLYKEWKLK